MVISLNLFLIKMLHGFNKAFAQRLNCWQNQGHCHMRFKTQVCVYWLCFFSILLMLPLDKSYKNRKVPLTIHCKYKYFDSTVQRAEDREQKLLFLPFAVNIKLNLSNITGQYYTLYTIKYNFKWRKHVTVQNKCV